MAEMMYSLPSDIKTEIFSQLPVNSILQCKRVCKTWRACVHELLNDPSFRDTQTKRLLSSPTTDATSSFTSFLAREKHSKPGNQFHIVGSCNGLVCLVDKNYNAYICNPFTFTFTREYVNLPALPPKDSDNKIIAIGFGYLPSTNEYKFVRIAFDGIRKIYVSVYTLGSGKWSIKEFNDDSYGDLRYVTVAPAPAAGFHSNGVICWNTITSSLSPYSNIIISFNLKSKKLGIDRSKKDEEMCMLGGRFCCIRTQVTKQETQQVTKQEICFKKNTMIDLIRIKPDLEKDFTPPFALEEKIFLSYDYMKFVSYDTGHHSQMSQMVDWAEILLPNMSKFEMIPYTMSLVSIRALGESVCVVAEREINGFIYT